MTVIFYIESFFPDPTGATYSAIRLAKALRDKGVQSSFIVDDRGEQYRDGGKYQGFDVQSFTLGQPGKFRKLRGLLRFTIHIVKHRKSFDVFHIHGGYYVTLFLCWWVKALTRSKVMLKITSDGWDTPEDACSSRYGCLVSFFYRRLDGVVAMTSGQEQKCRRWGFPNQVATIPNGVDCESFRPVSPADKSRLRKKFNIPQGVPTLCYAGWLGYRKGTDILFRVWNKLLASFGNLHLLLAGDYLGMAESRKEIERFLKKHDLPPELAYSSLLKLATKPGETRQALQSSDIFLFPSRKEGFGTVQIEAMACGLPCVVNDLPGVSSDIFPTESTGYRVTDNNIEQYTRILAEFLKNPKKRQTVGSTARERALKHFSIDLIADKYISFYKQLLSQAN
ncbi:MAG: glycosyltransferase family 4 protein [Kiritimatiellia bacterium]